MEEKKDIGLTHNCFNDDHDFCGASKVSCECKCHDENE